MNIDWQIIPQESSRREETALVTAMITVFVTVINSYRVIVMITIFVTAMITVFYKSSCDCDNNSICDGD